ncbi:MAG: 4'-phosphopantetheinyl transferase superfamily protein [Gammaproteobacteria bacterium]
MTTIRRDSSPQVWYITIDEMLDDTLTNACLGLLSNHEKQRHARFHFARDRALFLVSHAMLRVVLSQYAAVSPRDWQFQTNRFGRPELSASCADTGLRFNLTHTRGMAACIVTKSMDCGIDIEQLQRQSCMTDIARKMFSPSENLALEQAADAQKSRLFYSLWTLKEAYVKACGTGLTVSTRDFSFDINNKKDIAVSFVAESNDCPEQWYFSLYSPISQAVLATALRTKATPTISYHSFSTDQILGHLY